MEYSCVQLLPILYCGLPCGLVAQSPTMLSITRTDSQLPLYPLGSRFRQVFICQGTKMLLKQHPYNNSFEYIQSILISWNIPKILSSLEHIPKNTILKLYYSNFQGTITNPVAVPRGVRFVLCSLSISYPQNKSNTYLSDLFIYIQCQGVDKTTIYCGFLRNYVRQSFYTLTAKSNLHIKQPKIYS